MFDWTISFGALITMAIAIVGFFGTALVNAIYIGKFFGVMDKRLSELEKEAAAITGVLIELGKSKVELEMLARRIDDIQQYGSHRLAEVLEAIRGQITADFKERFEFLQREISKREPRR